MATNNVQQGTVVGQAVAVGYGGGGQVPPNCPPGGQMVQVPVFGMTTLIVMIVLLIVFWPASFVCCCPCDTGTVYKLPDGRCFHPITGMPLTDCCNNPCLLS
mmetsp:Transcript_40642/g.63625  ORF Transcript_40642/g.63625 Transcript_40642/m.63625 type:complete len:102 (-) Transcript_40642:16-321(-)